MARNELRFGLLDRNFAAFLGERSTLTGEEKARFIELAAKLSLSLSQGHSCLPINTNEERFLDNVLLVSQGEKTPLVVKNGNLYLHRYYTYESRLSSALVNLASVTFEVEDNFFKECPESMNLLKGVQDEAARLAVRKGFSIICGGPGTGKTTTVVTIITLLLKKFGAHLKIALTAPTGKAAVRLAESVAGCLRLFCPDGRVKLAIPDSAFTLHRLLGYTGSPRFLHNTDNPMTWDVVIVDEASMVDLAMMSKLLDALKSGARLILLGDKDQLASVESGSVLADLIASFPDNSIELTHTYRFDENIKQLASHINNGNSSDVWNMLVDPAVENITLVNEELFDFIGEKYIPYMTTVQQWNKLGIKAVFHEFRKFQVLCAVHYGRRGVEGLNSGIEMYLRRKGFDCQTGAWYLGRPILITQNDYNLELFNGDIGICLPDRRTGGPVVHFLNPQGNTKNYSMQRLPSFETVYCMTIHKSQGSEFEQVMVILPVEDNQVLCRELIYTGVTRAKQAVSIVAERDLLDQSLKKTVKRDSGLRRMLRDKCDKLPELD